LCSVDGRDKVVKLDGVPQSSVGAPSPLVLGGEANALLLYIVEEAPIDWDSPSTYILDSVTPDESFALVEFTGCWSHMFGWPNDEVFHVHPLNARGLKSYGAFQIEKSSWIRLLEKMNSVHSHHRPERFERLRHYIFSFHGSTFECIAEGFTVSMHKGSFDSMWPIMRSRLKS